MTITYNPTEWLRVLDGQKGEPEKRALIDQINSWRTKGLDLLSRAVELDALAPDGFDEIPIADLFLQEVGCIAAGESDPRTQHLHHMAHAETTALQSMTAVLLLGMLIDEEIVR